MTSRKYAGLLRCVMAARKEARNDERRQLYEVYRLARKFFDS